MADIFTKKQRRYCMSRIRAKNTRPEIIFRKAITSAGIRSYRLHYKLLGKPDVVFPKRRIAVFIDGCFWHKCPKCFKKLSTKKKYWIEKIESNIKRDKLINCMLKKKGWKILRFWEHDINKNLENKCISRMKKVLRNKKFAFGPFEK